MQTSSIMLDSTLGKILTADEVDKSLQPKDSNANETITNEEQATTNSSEAEVRLVFRFTVEEQLVYKGKIEKVQQLQSEELSRLVSKIAWDGAKEAKNKEMLEKNNVIDPAHSNVDLKKSKKSHQKSLSTQTTETCFSSKIPISQEDLDCTEKGSEEIILEEKITCNIQSSDHQVNLKLKSPNLNQTVEDTSLSQVAQSQLPNLTCDNYNSEHSQNHARVDEGHEPSKQNQWACQDLNQDPQQPQESDLLKRRVFKTTDNDNSLNNIVFNSQKETENIQKTLDEDIIDSQLIADTINECVNNIELESSLQIVEEVPCKDLVHGDLSREKEVLEKIQNLPQHDEQMIEIILEHDVPTDSKKNVNNRFDPNVIQELHTTGVQLGFDCVNFNDHKTIKPIFSEQISSDELGTDKNEDFNTERKHVTQDYKKDSTNNTTVSCRKKITSNHNPSGNRIRKSTLREQRNSLTRKSINKAVGNISAKQDSSSNMRNNSSTNYFHMKSNSNQEEQKQIRHTNKIFAKWTDNHYYPGTILRQAKDRKFVIGFLDGAQRNVAEIDLIPLSNIEGRQVRVSIAKNYCVNALVHQQSSAIDDHPMFDVEYQQEGIVRKSVPFKDIFLTGDQGSLLINQVDKNSGASNFADVDLDNIIYEKRSRRFQDMDDYELTENTSLTNKRKRGQYSMRNSKTKTSLSPESPAPVQMKRNSQCDNTNHDSEGTGSPDVLKTNFLCPNSNPPSESSSSTGSSNVPNVLELGQEFYFASSSPHRTKTSLLL